MKKHFYHIVEVLVLFVALGTPALAAEQPPLTMTVSLQKSYDETNKVDVYKLYVRLANDQTISISVENRNLPWLGFNDKVLVPRAVRLDKRRTLLVRGGPTADLMDATFELKPQDSMEDGIVLNTILPTLLEDISKYGVRIEWRCKVPRTPVVCPSGKGGSFVIPKGGLKG